MHYSVDDLHEQKDLSVLEEWLEFDLIFHDWCRDIDRKIDE